MQEITASFVTVISIVNSVLLDLSIHRHTKRIKRGRKRGKGADMGGAGDRHASGAIHVISSFLSYIRTYKGNGVSRIHIAGSLGAGGGL